MKCLAWTPSRTQEDQARRQEEVPIVPIQGQSPGSNVSSHDNSRKGHTSRAITETRFK
jgi:hypothetical protein